jgi:hypothetical protein
VGSSARAQMLTPGGSRPFLLSGDQGVAFRFRPVFINDALNVTVESFPRHDRRFGLDDDAH